MPTTQSVRRLPPTRNAGLTSPMEYWEQETQQHDPLLDIDTSGGSYSETTPPAGLNSATGQTNQNQERTYVKISADGNTYTLNGLGGNFPGGPLTLTTQWQFFKIKSNGTYWRRSG
jgi:hypothetical protein